LESLIKTFENRKELDNMRGNENVSNLMIFEKIFEYGLIRLVEDNYRESVIVKYVHGIYSREETEDLIGDVSHLDVVMKK